jgi:23S rRNA (guanosine2251-2'-O)-methyltransferase
MSSEFYIYGRNPVMEALNSGKEIEKIYVLFGRQEGVASKIVGIARKQKIPVVTFDKKKFSALEKNISPNNINSQGIIALISPIKYADLEELADKALAKGKYPVLIALDSVNDPHNLGAIARSAECSGAAGIILPERNSAPVTPGAIKSSAGSLNYLPVSKVGNLNQALDMLKEKGFWVVGTDMAGSRAYSDPIYDRPVCIVIGSEGKGLRPAIAKNCDMLINIPMHGKIDSLNASVTAGVILFEILRQQTIRGSAAD